MQPGISSIIIIIVTEELHIVLVGGLAYLSGIPWKIIIIIIRSYLFLMD